ncbi:MAG TPA: hypothetical protein VJ249_04700 [Candidatus Bathyarchaeia archaeon]|nr:hypothetical protein [Candidatus Bathyarchaeia archaeon]
MSGTKFKWLSFGIAIAISGLLLVQLYTSTVSRSLHEEWHIHLVAGHTQIAEDVERQRESILTIHMVAGFLSILLAIIEALIIIRFWKTQA